MRSPQAAASSVVAAAFGCVFGSTSQKVAPAPDTERTPILPPRVWTIAEIRYQPEASGDFHL